MLKVYLRLHYLLIKIQKHINKKLSKSMSIVANDVGAKVEKDLSGSLYNQFKL